MRCFFSGYAPVIIRPGRETDLLPVQRIADKQLGDGYISEKHALRLSEPDSNFMQVAELGDELVGFVIGLTKNPGEVREITRTTIPKHLAFANKIGVNKTVAVSHNHHGLGIGTMLVQTCVDEFRKRKVHALCSVAWKHKETINIQGVLKKQGFSFFAEVPGYWVDESIKDDFKCPQCGPPPCHCSAVMFSQVIH